VASPVVTIGGTSTLGWDEYEAVVYDHAAVEISETHRIDQHREELERQVAAGATIYSVNTGYGADADRRLPPESIDIVQANTLRSHAMGTGPDAPEHIVRGQMLLKAQAYAQGPAALRLTLVERIVWCLNNRVCPAVPVYGSQSASGDLVPNAHLGLAFMGEGFVVEFGARRPAHEVMPNSFVPAMKEGVALTNDCSFATAYAYGAVRGGTRLIDRTEEVAAMTLQALRGHPEAFDDRLVALRPHPGARRSAAAIRALIDQSDLLGDPGRPHDPYSLRCIPQVHGAIRDAVAYARSVVEIELGSIGDNPVVLLDDQTTLSGGNIHGEPIAIPMDIVTIAMAELAVLSQRRTAHLVNTRFDIGLPPKLSRDPGNGFGLLMLNTTAAALVSEIRTLTAPAAVESIEVDHMEDHVSMAAVAARKATTVISLVRRVVAAELVCAAQALDFHGAERASKPTRDLHSAVRERIPFVSADRPIDVEQVVDLL
jgi:histidine ammonia-lyase